MKRFLPLVFAAALGACATGGRKGGALAERAAAVALEQVGRPYRFGGSEPAKGFDCSGLVQYSFAAAGRRLPRSTEQLLKSAQKLSLSKLRRGDLIFFDQEGKKASHVAIYLGERKFIHAPSSGKRVRVDGLDERYWQDHLTAARRVLD